MPGKNVLLIIVDCLRYDRAEDPKLMPFLSSWGTHFHNHWSTSHCTDPAITHMLFGLHPDELKLYSMMYGDKSYNIAPELQPVTTLARDNDYWTAVLTNLGRWYFRGAHLAVNTRDWPGEKIFMGAYETIQHFPGPWFVVVHTDDAHTRYTGGSYDAACAAVDGYIEDLVKTCVDDNTLCIITSDHGEGLGQRGPDGVAIDQHGYGLWDFLTHVPFITNAERLAGGECALTDPGTIYMLMRDEVICPGDTLCIRSAVFQAGATPKVFHRGVVVQDGGSGYIHYIRATTNEGHEHFIESSGYKATEATWMTLELALAEHCAAHSIEYGELLYQFEAKVVERLKGLGYWPE